MSEALTLTSTLTMNDGHTIPRLGYGVFQVTDGAECERSVRDALDAGYRHLDTAWVYGNEQYVGNAVEQSGIPREDLFVTTKTVFEMKPDNVRNVFAESLEKLKTDYVDLFLIHWPLGDENLVPTWETMEALKEEGQCRSIGISNFTVERLQSVFLPHIKTMPAMNQIELHVYNQQPNLVQFCREKGMQLTAYSPLSRGQKLAAPAPELADIANAHGKSVAQIMLRFLIQQDIVVLAKTVTKERMIENADIFDFELTDEQMQILKGLDEGLTIQDWFPKDFY